MTSVLVVEDDQMFAKSVGRDLQDQGFVVSLAHSVEDALPMLSSAPFDVLLTDLQLGAQDGIDLLASLREVAPRTRAVLMSGFATARDYQRAVELGAVRVLCKPFTPTELIQCIRQAVECETGFRGSVHGLSLIDMLQMFNYGRRTVTITVVGHSTGRLLLRDGQIFHAEHGELEGEAAVRSVLAMSGGTLSTAALAAETQVTVTRDFREVLLDALRALDEASQGSSGSDELSFDELIDEPAPESSHAQLMQQVREIDGYVAACLVLSESGGVLDHDGSIDLRPAAASSAEVVCVEQRMLGDMGIDDVAEEVLVTSRSQYHLMHALPSGAPAFLYLVLDRRRANPAMATRALVSAMRALDL